jgi:hypothetical protein
LLGDALLWDELLKVHGQQVSEVKDFISTYWSDLWSVLRPRPVDDVDIVPGGVKQKDSRKFFYTNAGPTSEKFRDGEQRRMLASFDYSEQLKAVAKTTQELIELVCISTYPCH